MYDSILRHFSLMHQYSIADTLNLAMHGSNEIALLCGLMRVDSETSLEGLSYFTVIFNHFLVAQLL